MSHHDGVDLKWLAGSIGEVADRMAEFPQRSAAWANRTRDCRIAEKVLKDLAENRLRQWTQDYAIPVIEAVGLDDISTT